MMGIRSLEAKLMKNMSMVLQNISSDTAFLGRLGDVCLSSYHFWKMAAGISGVQGQPWYMDNSSQSRIYETVSKSKTKKMKILYFHLMYVCVCMGTHVIITCVGQSLGQRIILKSRLLSFTLLR